MDMRLTNVTLDAESPTPLCRSQINVEGDVTLPGSLRETANVLYAAANPVVERAEALQDRVNIAGRVVFCVVYTQGEEGKLNSIEATADFTHLCEMPGAAAHARVDARAAANQVEAHVQNGRMTMRARIELCGRAVNCEPAEAISSIGLPGTESRTAHVELRRRAAEGKTDSLLREEFELPADLAIRDTLGATATAAFFDAAGGQGRIGLSGEVTIEAIHASNLPGKPLVTTRHTVPVSQSVEISGEDGDLLDGRIVVKDVAVASQDMGDGERTLRAEVLLGLEAWAEQTASAELLTDAYTTSGDALRLTGGACTLRTGSTRSRTAESGKAAILLPDGAAPVRTMLAAFAAPVMSSFNQQGSRLITEGTMNATLIYMTDRSDAPVSARVEAPFRAAFAASAAPEDLVTLTAANVEAVPITSDRVELRYILQAETEGLQTTDAAIITDAAAVPAAPVTTDIVLCFAQPGESSWDIARRYRIPESELRSLNPELNGEPKTGQGLVVWRRNPT